MKYTMPVKYREWNEETKEMTVTEIDSGLESMPWTGWSDSDGKPIYLGDIVESSAKEGDRMATYYGVIGKRDRTAEIECMWLGNIGDDEGNCIMMYELFNPGFREPKPGELTIRVVANKFQDPDYLAANFVEARHECMGMIKHFVEDAGGTEIEIESTVDKEQDKLIYIVRCKIDGKYHCEVFELRASTQKVFNPLRAALYEGYFS